MAYTKNNWQTGDIVTAAKLNHMEDGIAGTEADVTDLKSALTYKTDNVYGGNTASEYLTLVNGKSWGVDSGTSQTNNKRARTDAIKMRADMETLSIGSGYYFTAYGNDEGVGNALTQIGSTWVSSLDLTSVTYKYLFVVVKRSDNGVITGDDLSAVLSMSKYTNVKPYALQENLESEISDVYSNVDLVEDAIGLKLIFDFERGNLTYVSGDTTPTASTYNQNWRARTPVDKPISLKQGTVISVKDSDSYLVEIYFYSNSTMTDTGFVKSYTLASNQDVWLVVKAVTESGNAIDVSTLKDQLVIETSKYSVNEIANCSAWQYPIEIGGLEQTARIGWNVYDSSTPPEQSIPSYALAYKNGCRIMLCDLRVTSDGKFVCRHDSDLGGNTVMNLDGTPLTAEEKAYKIAELTLAELDGYDFGIYKGSQYAGTKILRFVELLKFCKVANCRVFVETKVSLTSAQVTEIVGMIKKHGMQDMIIWGDLPYSEWGGTSYPLISNNLPNSVICIRATESTYTQCVNCIETYASAEHPALMIFDDYELITDTVLNELMSKNIDVGYTEIKYASTLEDMVDSGIIYNIKNVASSYINLGKYFGELYGL